MGNIAGGVLIGMMLMFLAFLLTVFGMHTEQNDIRTSCEKFGMFYIGEVYECKIKGDGNNG